MRRAKRPFNPEAIKAANEAVSKHTGGRPLHPTSPADAKLREMWMDKYVEVAGPDSVEYTQEDRKPAPKAVQKCPLNEKNFVKLKYKYADGKGIPGALYEVRDLDTKAIVASGSLDNEGYAFANIPVSTKRISFNFHQDPATISYLKQPVQNPDLSKVEQGWSDRMMAAMKNSIVIAGEWSWGVIQGDFNEDPAISQIMANMVITLIPFVDQAGDVRDIVANLKILIYEERYDELAAWFALVVTLIGAIPEIGSVAKGIIKTIIKKTKDSKKVSVEQLFEVFNYFAKGNAKKYLKEFSAKLPEYSNFIKSKLKLLLNKLIEWFDWAITKLPESVSDSLRKWKASTEKVKSKVDEQVDKQVKEIKNNLDESLKETTDLSKEGIVKGKNERMQNAEPPPHISRIPSKTVPSRRPNPNAKPQGEPTKVQGNKEAIRALTRENESADILAKNGYDIKQLKQVKGKASPDYSIEGKTFDCYSPSTTSNKGVRDTISKKVNTQAERVVLNIQDWTGDLESFRKYLKEDPITDLKEILVINKDGSIIHFFP